MEIRPNSPAASGSKRYDTRLDQRDEEYRKLEREVRTEITTQLIAATSTIKENATIMERVIDKLSR